MTWLSPAFPVGAFAYSHGLEFAYEAGDLPDRAALQSWLGDLIDYGSGRNDAILLVSAWRTAGSGDAAGLASVNELALALQPSAERLLETTTQGNAFVAAIRAAWHAAGLGLVQDIGTDIAYPVAVGAAAAAHDLPLLETVEAFLLAFAANLVSAAVRLGIVGQTDGQRVTAALAPRAAALAAGAPGWTLDDLGSSTVRSDLASLRHETQYTRLFRS